MKKFIMIFLVLILFSSLINAEEDSKKIIEETIQISSRTRDSLLNIQSFFPEDLKKRDERYILNEELKKDLETIETKKDDIDRYEKLENYKQVNQTSKSIIYLSNKIYSYECMFRLRTLVEAINIHLFNHKIRVKNIALEEINPLIKQKDRFLNEGYFIKLEELFEFDTFEDYYSECSIVSDSLWREYQSLDTNYQPFDLGGWGFTLLAITIAFLVWMGSSTLFNKKIINWSKEKIVLLMKIIITILGILWGLFFIQFESIFWRGVAGGIIGFILYLILQKILLFLKHNVFRIPRAGLPIERLNLDQEYKNILEEEGIKTTTELVESNIKELSESTHLQVETLVKFRNKARQMDTEQNSESSSVEQNNQNA